MPYGLYLSAAGADVQSRRIETLSNNLANVGSPGFKRQLAVIQARHAAAIEQGLAEPGARGLDDQGGGVLIHETRTDFGPGVLQQTGGPLDAAIAGDLLTFFAVERDGQQLLTRAGNFSLRPDGVLATAQGYPVLGLDGRPIVAAAGGPAPAINPAGEIVQGTVPIGALRLLALPGADQLQPLGENLFRPLTTPQLAPPGERRVLPGFVEQAAVKPTTEMMELIEASRAYEANVRLIQHHDSMIGSLVSRVLKV